MASYFSSLLTTTTSRVASIRQNLLPTEADGDTEDDTHICRVLRAYYTEKGRAFPAWLPPDPKAPPPVVVQPVYSQSSVGSRYGGLGDQNGGAGGARTGLGSLWDKQPSPQPQQGDSGSLRQGRAGGARMAAGRNPFARENSSQSLNAPVQGQPLPSSKQGSMQNVMFGRSNDPVPPRSSGGMMTAKQKLQAQQLGGRSGSPSNLQPPMGSQRSQSYESGGNNGGGGGYEEQYVPGGGYGGGGRQGGAYDEGAYGGGGSGGRANGLPSGPGAGRRGPGLPSGPRGVR